MYKFRDANTKTKYFRHYTQNKLAELLEEHGFQLDKINNKQGMVEGPYKKIQTYKVLSLTGNSHCKYEMTNLNDEVGRPFHEKLREKFDSSKNVKTLTITKNELDAWGIRHIEQPGSTIDSSQYLATNEYDAWGIHHFEQPDSTIDSSQYLVAIDNCQADDFNPLNSNLAENNESTEELIDDPAERNIKTDSTLVHPSSSPRLH
ncbi:hypothetical protein QTN25_006329 [Entamoeba marina]